MKVNLRMLGKVANRVKTPLSLSGMVILVLCVIYRQILSMEVFENIGATSTFNLLQDVVHKLFILALVATGLGVGSYLLTSALRARQSRRSSSVRLVDAGLDEKDSPYEERVEDGRRIIRPRSGHVNQGGESNDKH